MTGLDAPLVKGFLVMDPSPEELHFLDGLYFFVRNLDFFWCYVFKIQPLLVLF